MLQNASRSSHAGNQIFQVQGTLLEKSFKK